MKHLLPCVLTSIFVLSSTFGYANEAKAELTTEKRKAAEEFTKEDVRLLSQAYGHMIGQNLNAIGLDLDSKEIIAGIQGAFDGMESPLNDSKTIEMITALQEKKFKDECNVNLKAAEAFLASNAENRDVVQLEKGRLQYKQILRGSGQSVKESDSPVISYTGKYLNGEVFGKSNQDEAITLSDTIEGFRKAIVGMKVGEKREVYIHPNLGYGVNSCLSPNALLTFEIEVKSLEQETENVEQALEGSDFPLDETFATSAENVTTK